MDKILLKLYKKTILVRLVEEKISSIYGDQQMRCPVHLSIGQEAASVGICLNLNKKDRIFNSHRSHAQYLSKGGNLKKMIAELYGKKTGCCAGRGGSMHLFDKSVGVINSIPIVGSGIGLAVGSAMSSKLNNLNIVSVAFFGDAACEEGIFHESMNLASLKNLPVLFVCENNFYSVYTPLHRRQPKRPLSNFGFSHNIKTLELDGKDIFNIYNKSNNLLNYIKKEMKPAFLVINTYRKLEHCGPDNDDHLNYRNKLEIDHWKKKDPLLFLQKKILKSGLNKSWMDEQIRNTKNYIEKTFREVEKDPMPKAKDISRFVYAE